MMKAKQLVVLSLFAIASLAAATTYPNDSRAQAFVQSLNAGQFDVAAAQLGEPLSESMDAARLQHDWKNLIDKNGGFLRIVSVKHATDRIGANVVPVVVLICNFEKQDVRVRLSFNKSGRITSLWFNAVEEKM